jgi:hypothetical protein
MIAHLLETGGEGYDLYWYGHAGAGRRHWYLSVDKEGDSAITVKCYEEGLGCFKNYLRLFRDDPELDPLKVYTTLRTLRRVEQQRFIPQNGWLIANREVRLSGFREKRRRASGADTEGEGRCLASGRSTL